MIHCFGGRDAILAFCLVSASAFFLWSAIASRVFDWPSFCRFLNRPSFSAWTAWAVSDPPQPLSRKTFPRNKHNNVREKMVARSLSTANPLSLRAIELPRDSGRGIPNTTKYVRVKPTAISRCAIGPVGSIRPDLRKADSHSRSSAETSASAAIISRTHFQRRRQPVGQITQSRGPREGSIDFKLWTVARRRTCQIGKMRRSNISGLRNNRYTIVLATVWDQAWRFIPRDGDLSGFDPKAGFGCQVSAPRGVIAREGSF
jgi:hypothetical protein